MSNQDGNEETKSDSEAVEHSGDELETEENNVEKESDSSEDSEDIEEEKKTVKKQLVCFPYSITALFSIIQQSFYYALIKLENYPLEFIACFQAS